MNSDIKKASRFRNMCKYHITVKKKKKCGIALPYSEHRDTLEGIDFMVITEL